MVADNPHIPPPLPKEVNEARNRIIDAVLRLTYADVLALAAELARRERDALLASVPDIAAAKPSAALRCLWKERP